MPLRIEPDGKQRTCLTLQGQVLAIRLVENTSRTEREPTEKERQEIQSPTWPGYDWLRSSLYS